MNAKSCNKQGSDFVSQDYKPPFEILKFGYSGGRGEQPEAKVKLRIGEDVLYKVGEGNGPVDASDHALRNALERHFPDIKNVILSDYHVELPPFHQKGTASEVHVRIETLQMKVMNGVARQGGQMS